jgi:hypothetical protein
MANWSAYGAVFSTAPVAPLAFVGSPPLLKGKPCAECGTRCADEDLVNLKGVLVCAACKPIALQKILEGGASLGAGQSVWRSGKLLIMKSDAPLPNCCVKCGEVATTRLQRKLFWHPPWVFCLILISILVYAIVAMVMRKRGNAAVPLCEAHRARRVRGIMIGWGLALLSMGALAIAISQESGAWGAISGVLLLTGLITGMVMARLLTPTKIDEHLMTLKGCCPAFLAKLPEYYQ